MLNPDFFSKRVKVKEDKENLRRAENLKPVAKTNIWIKLYKSVRRVSDLQVNVDTRFSFLNEIIMKILTAFSTLYNTPLPNKYLFCRLFNPYSPSYSE